MSTLPGDSPNGHPTRASNPRCTRRVSVVGKGGHVRTVPIPIWVNSKVDAWLAAAAITGGPERKKGKKAALCGPSDARLRREWRGGWPGGMSFDESGPRALAHRV
jgi:hypothetical protein